MINAFNSTDSQHYFLPALAIIAAALSGTFLETAAASTQVGEMRVLESTGPNEPDPDSPEAKSFRRTLKTRMLFRHYFSTPSEATPTDEFTSPASGGAWKPRETLFFVDGRPVQYHIGARMLKPGAIIYYYINRRIPQFISIHTHAKPVMGRVARKDDDALVLRRLIGLKFESSGTVYSDEKVSIDKDARYLLDGKESEAEHCVKDQVLVRAHPAQPLTISAFTNDALLQQRDFASPYVGTRTGFITKGDDSGLTIAFRSGSEWAEEKRGLRKASALWDGQFMFDRTPVLQAGSQAVSFSYRGNTEDSLFVIGRSAALAAVDGEILEISNTRIKVQTYPSNRQETWALGARARQFLNGQPAKSGNLGAGMKVTIFKPRPQVIDCWTLSPVAVPDDMEKVLYDIKGKRTVLQPGRLPKRLEADQKAKASKK